MKIRPADFRVRPGAPVDLDRWPTEVPHLAVPAARGAALARHHLDELRRLQQLLYAANRYALLLVFQGMDAAGKDGAIGHVMSGVNPQGCRVYSFKPPSAAELQHDFLWRTTRVLPERGQIGIFNRSYYEEVLVARVHPALLAAEHLPPVGTAGEAFWQARFRSIVDLERHLHESGTRVVKFFLHLSKAEQRRRFVSRISVADKNWKFSASDFRERGYWKAYRRAYGACIAGTGTAEAPWYVVPADDKVTARLVVSEVILDTLGGLDMHYPVPDAAARRWMRTVRRRLAR
jgi:PPK2 family polyphosphate:nucleotide phosphotransferase